MDDAVLDESLATKTCRKCNIEKPVSEFYRQNAIKKCPYKREGTCKSCRYLQQKKRLATDPVARESELEAKRRHNRKYAPLRKQKKIEEHIAAHGQPVCGCGCGELAGFNKDGEPYKFRSGHARRIKTDINQRILQTRIDKEIEITKFRQAILKISAERGLSGSQLAKIMGISDGHYKSLIYDKRKEFVQRDLAEVCLRRLAGLATPPTPYEQRMYEESLKNR